jgi:hypothetical protein
MNGQLNWSQLLRRIEENSALLHQLEDFVKNGGLKFGGFSAVLIESGFTIPETQELYGLLEA